MTCADGAEIIYTTDGTVPSATNGVRVSGGAQVSLIIDTTLKAIAVQTGYADSSVAAAEYTIRSTKPVSKMLLGDTDGDNDVTIVDATMIQRYLVNLPTSSFFPQVSDTDGDGDITIVDATAIQRYLAQLSCPDGIGQPV